MVVSAVAFVVLVFIGWHYVSCYRDYRFRQETTCGGLFGEPLGVVVPMHSSFSPGNNTVETWGGVTGPMIVRFAPKTPSPFFDEYRAHSLPRSKRTIRIVGIRKYQKMNECRVAFKEVLSLLREKYGDPLCATEGEVQFRESNRVIRLSIFCGPDDFRLEIEAFVPRLVKSELIRECMFIAREDAASARAEADRLKAERARGL